MSEQRWDVIVVGAGPAGMAAATAAARAGKRVAVVDDNAAVGGQIWRAGLSDEATHADRVRQRRTEAFLVSGATLLSGRRVVGASPGAIDTWTEGATTVERLRFDRLVLATGARERFLPFPGWTLPGVFGAGGLQALVQGGFDVHGKRVMVGGTGPLLLAVAAHLREDGAEVLGVCEQGSLRQVMPFGLRLWNRWGKLRQAAGLMRQLRGVRQHRGTWVVAAHGVDRLEAVELTDGKRRWRVPCDLLACGFHLVPNTELPSLLGCRLDAGRVAVDALQRTSVQGVLCAGEPTGIAGVDAALLEGEIAGLVAAGREQQAQRLVRRAAAERRFGEAMERAFRLRPELLQLCAADTIVCRCEDVRFGELSAMSRSKNTWTDAKLQTRCGMGACQGRICGPAVHALFGWKNESVRPPIFPIPLAAFACELSEATPTMQHPQETR